MSTRRRLGTALLVLWFGACASGEPDDVVGDGGDGEGGDAVTRCTSNDQCNDRIECTVDTCGVGNLCEHTPVHGLCTEPGALCLVGRGCVVGACSSSDECNDGIDCTTDTCGVESVCQYTPLDALCGDGRRCDTVAGCTDIGDCITNDDCDDSTACTTDLCVVGWTCSITPHDEMCASGETCHSGIGCYTPIPCPGGTDAECQDGNVCNGSERCIPEFGCSPGDPPPSDYCLDEDACTDDVCDLTEGRCTHTFNGSIPGCSPFDINGCYSLSRTISQRCALGGVNYNFSQICCTQTGPSLSCTAGAFTLSGMHTASDYAFDVSLVISGDCEERYRIQGAFTDNDNFTATWTAQYVSTGGGLSCALGGCANQTFPITGSRI